MSARWRGRVTPAQERTLLARLEAARQVYNACLGQARRRVRLVRESKAFQHARTLPRDDPARKAAYADSLKWVGQAYWYQGDLGPALQNFQEASTLLAKLVAANPQNREFADKLGYARNNVGHVLEARGDFVVFEALGSQENHLGPLDLKIR